MRALLAVVLAASCSHDLSVLAGRSDGGAERGGSGGSTGSGGVAGRIGSGGRGPGGSASGGSIGVGGAAAGQAGVSGPGGSRTGGAGALGAIAGSGGALGACAALMGQPEVLFCDDFEEGTAAKWTSSGHGSWSVVTDGTKVLLQSSPVVDPLIWMSAGDQTWTNYSIEAKVKFLEGRSALGIAARVKDTASANAGIYYALFLSNESNEIDIYADNVNMWTPLDNPLASGVWYTIRFEVFGSALRAYLNGELSVSTASSSLSSGRVLLWVDGVTAEFDDIVVRKAP